MRKVVLLAALAITGLIAVAPAAQAQTQPFSASFKGKQRLKDPPCATGLLCGSGSIGGFGDATYSALPVSLGPVAGSCQALTALVFIDLEQQLKHRALFIRDRHERGSLGQRGNA